jgi:predicted nucleic acid-binding protein
MVVAPALTAKAQYLVTRDKDLLSISYEGIRILSPEDFMALLRKR